MIREYIADALKRASYEKIEAPEPYYGEIKACPGVWATGRTLEECRKNLEDTLDGWIFVHISKGIKIPRIGKAEIKPSEKVA